MRLIIQMVKKANVTVDKRDVAGINSGLLLLVGIGKDDGNDDIDHMARKVSNLRIFEDEQGKMNLNIQQVKGEILSVPQFTLYADTRKGNRPGFDMSADPEIARELWMLFNDKLRADGLDVKEGSFGAHMEVGLINDGPVTIWLDSKKTVNSNPTKQTGGQALKPQKTLNLYCSGQLTTDCRLLTFNH